MAEDYKEDVAKEEETGLTKEKKDEITAIACKQVKACIDFKQPRMEQIKEIEDMLAYKLQPTLKGRLNVPFDGVVMNGFIDTLLAQANSTPRVVFSDSKGSNLEAVAKTQAFFDEDTGHARAQWKRKLRWSKKLCAVSNIGILETHAESDPKYKSFLNVIDHYDFIFEPTGGADLEEHLYTGRLNIFKTESDLDNPLYDKTQVAILKKNTTDEQFKKNEDIYQNKQQRFQALGLQIETNNYAGQTLYNLTEMECSYGGERYYILFDYNTGTWIRFEKLEDVFESNLYSYTVWNAQENPFTLMGPGPADMIKVIAESIRLNLNEILNNNRKRNWDMKAVDSRMFPDISALDWKQDGIVHANVIGNQSIQNGIYHFQTPELSGALNLNTYFNSFVGINSGISDQSKSVSTQDTLGIAKLDDLNLSKRMKLIGDSFNECLASLAIRWDWNQWEHLDDEYAIKVLGKDGPKMTNFGKKDSEPDYDIDIVVDQDQMAEDKLTKETKAAALERLSKNPTAMSQLNPRWYVSQELMIGGWKEEEIQIGMNKDDFSAILISKANKAIETILLGEEAEDVPDATPLFLQIIHNYLIENKLKLEPKVAKKLEEYFYKQADYAKINAFRASQKAPEAPQLDANGKPIQTPNPAQTTPPAPVLPANPQQ